MPSRRQFVALLIAAPALAGPLAGHAAEVKKKGGGLSFIQLPTLTATIIRGDGRRGVLTVEAGLDIPDGGLRARVDLYQPRLRSAYVLSLQTYASGLSGGAPPNADYISRMLQQQTNIVLGQSGARLLLGTILMN